MLDIYKASAGSGKTFKLAREYIKYMLGYKPEGADKYVLNKRGVTAGGHRRILAMTFTNKATEEMKSRIVHELAVLAGCEKGWTQKSDYEEYLCKTFSCEPEELAEAAHDALINLLYDFGGFNVSTIDSFFQVVLRSFAHEAEVSSNYQLELDDKEVIKMSVDEMLQSLNRSRTDREMRRLEAWLTDYMKSKVDEGLQFTLFNRDSQCHLGLVNFVNSVNNDTFRKHEEEIMEYLRDKTRFEDFCKAVLKISSSNEPSAELLDLARRLKTYADSFPEKTVNRFFKNTIDKFVDGEWNAFEKNIGATIPKIETEPKSIWNKNKENTDPAFQALACEFADRFMTEYRQCMTIRVVKDNLYQLGLLSAIMTLIDKFRIENSTLLLSDTNALLSKVIGDENSLFVYEKIGTRYNHYLIDEFQDTSKSQWDNMSHLLTESLSRGNDSLVIGDEKQCIYRFRDSDPSLLHNLHEHILTEGGCATYGDSPEDNSNYRSSADVIRFNNSLFDSIASIYGLTDVYANVKQNIPEAHLNHRGYVKICFNDYDKLDPNDELALSVMSNEMRRQILDGGYNPSDIVVLVRDKNDGKKVFEYLERLKVEDATFPQIDVISDKSLLISSSNAVASIISRLRLLASIDVKPGGRGKSARDIARVLDEYDRLHGAGMAREEAIERAINSLEESKSEALKGDIVNGTHVSDIYSVDLLSLVENIIDVSLDEALRKRDNIFITSFVDLVANYLSQGNGDVMSFLEWWDETGSSNSIPGGDNSNAISILTMHKSKGLEFKCVHIPFAANSGRGGRDLAWFKDVRIDGIDPEIVPPMMPLQVSETLMHTPFKSQYETIVNTKVLDMTNLLYVAFTRAIDELIVSVSLTKTAKDLKKSNESLAGIIYRGIVDAKFDGGICYSGSGPFELGAPTTKKIEPEKKKSAMKPSKSEDSLTYSLSRNEALWGQTAVDQSRLNSIKVARERGLMIHQILSFVRKPEDVSSAMNVFAASNDGLQLTAAEIKSLREIVETRVSAVGARIWFKDFKKAYIEREILLESGETRRVDRVVWTATGEIHVVDYKTGSQEPKRYYKIMREYMKVFTETTDLPVRGFLYYLDSGHIEEVP